MNGRSSVEKDRSSAISSILLSQVIWMQNVLTFFHFLVLIRDMHSIYIPEQTTHVDSRNSVNYNFFISTTSLGWRFYFQSDSRETFDLVCSRSDVILHNEYTAFFYLKHLNYTYRSESSQFLRAHLEYVVGG